MTLHSPPSPLGEGYFPNSPRGDLSDEESLALVVQSFEGLLRCQPVNGHHFFGALKLRLADGAHVPEANYLGNFSCVIAHPTSMALNFDIEARLFSDFSDRALQP